VHLCSSFGRKSCSKWFSPKRAAPVQGRAARAAPRAAAVSASRPHRCVFPRSSAPSRGHGSPPDASNAWNASSPELPCNPLWTGGPSSVVRCARAPKRPLPVRRSLGGSVHRLKRGGTAPGRGARPPPRRTELPPAPTEQPRRAPFPGQPRVNANPPPPPLAPT
jgi:hypothetical protein